jgi:hypothetical protein
MGCTCPHPLSVGAWAGDQKEGQGIMVYPSGNTYTGSWAADLKAGEGIMVWASSGQVGGQQGRPQCRGVFVYASVSSLHLLIMFYTFVTLCVDRMTVESAAGRRPSLCSLVAQPTHCIDIPIRHRRQTLCLCSNPTHTQKHPQRPMQAAHLLPARIPTRPHPHTVI